VEHTEMKIKVRDALVPSGRSYERTKWSVSICKVGPEKTNSSRISKN
jgi:hypothetical protein